ncbi:MAG: C39 family peptidase, partial [Polyangiaceae bacterium]
MALPPNRIAVPVVKQGTNYSCGAAATLSMLRLWRADAFAAVEERSLFAALDTTEAHGTEPEPMVEVLQRQGGLSADYRHGDVTLAQLERAVDAGEPPIVDLQAWRDDHAPWRETWNAGHYVILVAHDRDNLYVMDPSVLTPGGYA